MRTLAPGLAAHLAAGVTTLARCWRIMRADGVTLGFTDHDRTLTFDGIDHAPVTGFSAAEVPSSVGLGVDTTDVVGALVSASLTEDDLLAGLYDEARVETWLVNWTGLDDRLLLDVGMIGEVTRTGPAFRAEIRSLAVRLDQERGRVFSSSCDAVLGDARCGVSLSGAGMSGTGTVSRVLGPRTVQVTGLDTIAAGDLRQGTLNWQSGENTGRRSEIREDALDSTLRIIDLWERPPRPVAVGDTFAATVGCDRRFVTCAARFANTANFRGFPYIPGNDFIITYAVEGENHDGGRLI